MGNLANGSPLIKKLIFFVYYLTRAESQRVTLSDIGSVAEIEKMGGFGKIRNYKNTACFSVPL